MAWKKPFDAQASQLVKILSVAAHVRPIGVDDSKYTSVENYIPRKKPSLPMRVHQVAQGILTVTSHLDRSERETCCLHLIAVSQTSIDRARGETKVGGVEALLASFGEARSPFIPRFKDLARDLRCKHLASREAAESGCTREVISVRVSHENGRYARRPKILLQSRKQLPRVCATSRVDQHHSLAARNRVNVTIKWTRNPKL